MIVYNVYIRKTVLSDYIGNKATVRIYTKITKSIGKYPIDEEIIAWIESGDEGLLNILNNSFEVDGVTSISSLKKIKIMRR